MRKIILNILLNKMFQDKISYENLYPNSVYSPESTAWRMDDKYQEEGDIVPHDEIIGKHSFFFKKGKEYIPLDITTRNNIIKVPEQITNYKLDSSGEYYRRTIVGSKEDLGNYVYKDKKFIPINSKARVYKLGTESPIPLDYERYYNKLPKLLTPIPREGAIIDGDSLNSLFKEESISEPSQILDMDTKIDGQSLNSLFKGESSSVEDHRFDDYLRNNPLYSIPDDYEKSFYTNKPPISTRTSSPLSEIELSDLKI